jgi:DNA-binding NarL/FixJ family response regulator
MKDAPIEKLFDAIRMVHRGGSYLDPMVTSKVMGAVGGKHHRGGAPLGTLSTRETTVLQMMAEGKRNKDISEALHISERTVKFHVSSMLGKLQASNRTEAVVVAAEQGIIRI